MRARPLALFTTCVLIVPAFAASALAQRPDGVARPAYTAPDRRIAAPPVAIQRDQRGSDRDRNDRDWRDRDPREREMYLRYTGREAQWQFAFRDGYDAGLRAGRDRRRFDPTREARFRAGDRGYHRGWGPRGVYVNHYRSAFRDGYDRGYYDGIHQRGAVSLFFRWGR